jgi:prohead serine protease
MPWRIERNKGDCAYAVVKESDGKTVGCHPTEEKAKAHLRALYANEPKKALDGGSESMNVFKIFAPTMTASRGTDGKLRIEGVASSTVRDHHGDQITRKALEKMAESARGLTIFMNHKYEVNDIFGTVERVKLTRTGQIDERTNEEIYDLRMGIVVQKKNPEAVKAFEMMEPSEDSIPTKLGLSIGAMVPEGGAKFDKSAGGRYIIDDIDLVETSLVTVPANPRSWVDYAVKSLAKGIAQANDLPAMIQKQRGALAELMEAEGVQIVDQVNEDELVDTPTPDLDADEQKLGDEGVPVEDDAAEPHTQPEVNDQASDDQSTEIEEHTDVPVDGESITDNTQKTRVTVWDGDKTVEVDTGRSKPKDQSAQDGDAPETAGGSGTTKSDDPEDLPIKAALETGDRLVRSLQGQLLASRTENDTLREERDAAIAIANKALEGTQEIIKKISDMPVGRRAVYKDVSEDFAAFRDDLYDADVKKILFDHKG